MIKFLRHLFVPHESNKHRAKILHLDSLILGAALLFFSFTLISTAHNSMPSVLGVTYQISTGDLLNITNQVRAENNLPALNLDSELSQAAANKASDMFTKNYWAHVAPDGVSPWVFIKNSGYDYLYAGENLARGFSGSAEVVKAWMASPTHRENMLSPNYKDVGFAIATGNLTGSDTVVVVEEFGSRYYETTTDTSSSATSMPGTTSYPKMVFNSSESSSVASGEMQGVTGQVASMQQQPLIDSSNLIQNISIVLLCLFIAILLIDTIIIERKKIVRVVSHNIDHILYLTIILLAIIIIGRGVIL